MSGEASVFWFTGLSGAGKSTICEAARRRVEQHGWRVLIVDGDDVRRRLHRDLGFTPDDIRENNALIVELCARLRRECDAIFVSIISPFRESRRLARELLGIGFFEIYCDAGIDAVAARDVKGLYAKAARNEITNLIGVSAGVPYEPPAAADLVLHTDHDRPERSIEAFVTFALEALQAAGHCATGRQWNDGSASRRIQD